MDLVRNSEQASRLSWYWLTADRQPSAGSWKTFHSRVLDGRHRSWQCVADILLATSPGGNAVTFSRTVGQVPIYYNLNTGRPPVADAVQLKTHQRSLDATVPFRFWASAQFKITNAAEQPRDSTNGSLQVASYCRNEATGDELCNSHSRRGRQHG